jgi:hypothetical protein
VLLKVFVLWKESHNCDLLPESILSENTEGYFTGSEADWPLGCQLTSTHKQRYTCASLYLKFSYVLEENFIFYHIHIFLIFPVREGEPMTNGCTEI